METAEHSTRPSVLPAKLRWRPYANGNTFKSNSRRKQAADTPQHKQQRQQPESQLQQELDAKTFAKRVRVKTQHSRKSHRPPVELELHWEEAETVESMSHGGHHSQHHDHHDYGYGTHSELGSHSDDSGSEEGSAARSRPHYHSTKTLASASFPSPPTSSTSPSSLRLDLSGDERDFTRFKASIPGLAGADFLKLGLPVPSIESNSSFHLALNSLLENHRSQQQRELQQKQTQKQAQQKTTDQSSATLTLSDIPSPTSVTGPPATLSNWGGPMNTTFQSSYPPKNISATELLGMTNIDELLVSCGYGVGQDNSSSLTFNNGSNILASPISSTQSIHSSPVHSPSDPFDPSVPTMAQLEALIAQVPLIQGYMPQPSPPQQGEQPMLFPTSTTTSTFADLFHSFTSPFTFLSSGDPLISGNSTTLSTWPSLFPKATEEVCVVNQLVSPKLAETSTQTEGWSSSKSSLQTIMTPPSTTVSSQSSPLGPSEQVVAEPEWLAFLDEVVSSSEMESATTATNPSVDASASAAASLMGSTIDPVPMSSSHGPSRGSSKGLLEWAGGMLSAHAMNPTGHRNGFSASSGSLGRTGDASAGSLVRMLKNGGGSHRASNDRTKAGSLGARPNIPSLPKPSPHRPVAKREQSKIEEKKTPEPVAARKTSLTEDDADSTAGVAPSRVPTLGAASEILPRVKGESKDEMGGLMAMFRGLWRGNGDT